MPQRVLLAERSQASASGWRWTATLSMKGVRVMDLVSTFLYFMPMLTVVLLGAVLLVLAYNLYLDRRSFVHADSTKTSVTPSPQSS